MIDEFYEPSIPLEARMTLAWGVQAYTVANRVVGNRYLWAVTDHIEIKATPNKGSGQRSDEWAHYPFVQLIQIG